MDSTSLREQELKLRVDGRIPTGSQHAEAQGSTDSPHGELQPLIPDLGDQYEILEKVGAGGMGTVYKVQDRVNGDTFAVKVLNREVSKDATAVKRFEQEVASASKLTHGNLVSVYKHGNTKEGTPYLVMDYYDGDNLSMVLEEKGELKPEEALELFIQLGGAISHAHKKGVVHRDIKPTNVIISRSEDGIEIPRVVDFGIAKVLPSSNRETLNFTETGEVFGSPEYMSPEQCLGFNLDHKSDIYSFGCLMYETLTGAPPFAGQNPIQLVVKHINEDVEEFPADIKKAKMAKELESIVLKCLEKEPENRFQSMDELVHTLELLQEGKAIPKFSISKKARPTLTNAQAYGGFMLLIFGLFALQGFIYTYYRAVSEYSATFILGALLTVGAYVFGSLTFGNEKYLKFWHDKPMKDWWKQCFCLSTTVFLSIVGATALLTGMTPLCDVNYLDWQNINTIISVTRWTAIVSALSMVASGVGSLVLAFDKKLSWKGFFAQHSGLLAGIYLLCLMAAPNLAARLPVYLGEHSAAPIASFLYDKATWMDKTYTRPLEHLCEQAIQKENYDRALVYVNKLLAIEPHNAYWYERRAKIYNAMGNTMLALADNEQAQALRPLELRFIDDRVKLLIKADQPMRAMSSIDRALYNDPGSQHFSSLKAALYARMGRFEDAIAALEQISQTKDNKNPFLHLQKAEYYRMMGARREAYLEYRNALFSSQVWWHDTELMPLVRAYAHKHLNEIKLSREELKLAKEAGLDKSELNEKVFTEFSEINLEW